VNRKQTAAKMTGQDAGKATVHAFIISPIRFICRNYFFLLYFITVTT
jgi:hypothetical protein